MKRIKYVLCVAALFVFMPIILFMDDKQDTLQAAGFGTAPTFSIGSPVYLKDKAYHVIATGNTIKLLADNATATTKTWAVAKSSAGGVSADLGALGSRVLPASKFTLPTTQDLSNVISGNNLSTSIPKISTEWWLGDASVNNRSKFVGENNQLNKEVSINKSIMQGKECIEGQTKEIGIKPTTSMIDANTTGSYEKYRFTMTFNTTAIARVLYAYRNADCTGNVTGGSYGDGDSGNFQYEAGVISSVDERGVVKPINNQSGNLSAILVLLLDRGLVIENGVQGNFVSKANVCYPLPIKVPDANSLEASAYKSAYDQNFNLTFSKVSTKTKTSVTCKGLYHDAGLASIRPMASIESSIIALGNNVKRAYSVAGKLDQNTPTSNGTQYLTLQTDLIGISLTSGAEGVSGTTLKTSLNADNTVTIPVTLSGTSEGTSYVSAKATDKNGNHVYGVLKQVNGTDTVNLDITNLVADPASASSIQVTLYQENAGSGNTAYISKGTDITINLSKPQEIAFDASNAKTISYGNDLPLTAKLMSATADQANTDITFTILTPNGESPKATIIDPTYTKATGVAQATLHPLTGTGSVIIAINKAGKGSAGAAVQKTWEVSFSKKEIDIKPTLSDKIYSIGEQMPALTSTSEGLANGDTIPEVLKPMLSPFDEHTEGNPATSSIIDKVGKWKLLYGTDILNGLTDFTQKYDVTLLDFDDDSKYVFETGIADVPEGWIEVTPNANAAGWNKEAVTIKPSAEAIAAGYTSVEIVDDENNVIKQGESVVYSASVESVIVKARLKNDTTKSKPASLREIKIDLTLPSATITVENQDTWIKGTKKVTIAPMDTFSGIDSVTITNDAGSTYSPTKKDGVYSFAADKNAIYTITMSDIAGNEKTFTQTIDKIEENEITLTAVPENLDTEEPSKDITVTRDAGNSGIKTFILYYKETEHDTYAKLTDLDPTNATFIYTAEMNGIYKFELVNNANQSKEAEVTITNVNPPVPVTKITAVYDDDNAQSYTSGKWTNHDIKLVVSNANLQITDQVKWKISEDNVSWSELGGDTKTISTQDILTKTYYVKGYVSKTPTDLEEITAKSIVVKIDKTKPDAPTIKDSSNYGADVWFKKDVQIETSVQPKVNNADIHQDIYVCAGTKSECSDAGATWKKTTDGTVQVSGNGSYVYSFKTMDEAGNESEWSEPVHVNIDNRVPNITITLNQNPIKELINELTFGFFFKENVDITFSSDIEYADIYYILDSSDHSTPPADEDERWKKGISTSLKPDAKAMIYVKAVSKAGVIGRESSQYDVYADRTAPVIDLPEDAVDWSKEITLEVPVSDAMSGVKKDSIAYSMDGGTEINTTLSNGNITISNLKDGSYPIRVKAVDNAGNTATKQVMVKMDHTKPSLDTPIAHPAGYAKEHTVTFHTSDSVSGLASGYPKVDGESLIANEDGSYSFTTTENKTYVINSMSLS